MKTIIISAFPGCGKTYLYENQNNIIFDIVGREKNLKFLDSDSSKYPKSEHWEKDYVDDLMNKIGSVDVIFISQHNKVLAELNRRKIRFYIVAPSNDVEKDKWFDRFKHRDNSHIKDLESWFDLLNKNFDNWISYEALKENNPELIIRLNDGEYIADKLEEIIGHDLNRDFINIVKDDVEKIKEESSHV